MAERGVIEYTTFSGVVLHITPLSVASTNRIAELAEAAYPNFDDAPFQVEIPDSAIEGATFLDTENAEYKRLLAELNSNRRRHENALVVELAVEYTEPTEKLLKRFEGRIGKIRRLLNLNGDLTDEEILLHQIALESNKDLQNILLIIMERKSITEAEIDNGLKIFRPALPGSGLQAASRQPPGVHQQSNPNDSQ